MKYIDNNIILMTDSYKVQHATMYPRGITKVYSYFESRNGARFNRTLFFGLQYIIKKYLVGEVVTHKKLKIAQDLIDKHLGPDALNVKGWKKIINRHGGKLPVRIKAIPEGTLIPTDNVLMTIENTDPELPWITNYLETILTHVWSSSTVATLSYETKKLLKHYLDNTSDMLDGLDFQLHDFGFRGVSSVESAGICGAGHLVNFMGTDTIAAIVCAMQYYNSDVCAFSVPATEHSIMTSYGREGENDLLHDLLNKYPVGILSIVIDSYDYENFIRTVAAGHKKTIMDRNGVIVFRPDSGDPITVTLTVMDALSDVFGCKTNSKGYKVLSPQVKMLWGDGIEYLGIRDILHALKNNGWSTENIVFGMGGGLLQKVNRDTQRFAFKSSAQERHGKWYDISKDPRDAGKRSKSGRLTLQNIGEGEYLTIKKDLYPKIKDELITVFENGSLANEITFEEVRKNARQSE
jgi:nicotinamide phosphoribosyltransferase